MLVLESLFLRFLVDFWLILGPFWAHFWTKTAKNSGKFDSKTVLEAILTLQWTAKAVWTPLRSIFNWFLIDFWLILGPFLDPKSIQVSKPPSLQASKPLNFQASEHPSFQASNPPSLPASKPPSLQTSKPPSLQASKPPSRQTSKLPSLQASKPLSL